MTPFKLRLARTLYQQGLQGWMQTSAQSECGVAAALRTQAKPMPPKFSRGFGTGDNAASAAGAAPKLHGRNMTGPYAIYGAVGAGAGLLFLLFGSNSKSVTIPGSPTGDQKTREQVHDERTEAGTHPKQIADFKMQSEVGKDVTKEDLLGVFQIIMFGDGVTNHALQGLHKLQEITLEQDRQSNMQMNKPLWVVEDTELMKSPEGRRKLQDAANDHARLQIIHGPDFGKIKASVQEYVKTLDKPSEEKSNCEEGVYYLLNPSGELVQSFGHDQTSQEIGLAIANEAKVYKAKNNNWHYPKAIKKRVG